MQMGLLTSEWDGQEVREGRVVSAAFETLSLPGGFRGDHSECELIHPRRHLPPLNIPLYFELF